MTFYVTSYTLCTLYTYMWLRQEMKIDLEMYVMCTDLYQWTAVDMGPCSGEYRTFTPSQVYAITSTEVFIVGNNSLLYR